MPRPLSGVDIYVRIDRTLRHDLNVVDESLRDTTQSGAHILVLAAIW